MTEVSDLTVQRPQGKRTWSRDRTPDTFTNLWDLGRNSIKVPKEVPLSESSIWKRKTSLVNNPFVTPTEQRKEVLNRQNLLCRKENLTYWKNVLQRSHVRESGHKTFSCINTLFKLFLFFSTKSCTLSPTTDRKFFLCSRKPPRLFLSLSRPTLSH